MRLQRLTLARAGTDHQGQQAGPLTEVRSLVKDGYEATFGQLSLALDQLAALDARLAGRAEWSRPEGGYFLWLDLPEGTDTGAQASQTVEQLMSQAQTALRDGRAATAKTAQSVFSTLRHAREEGSDCASVLTALGRLWASGVAVDWDAFYRDEERRRVALPPARRRREPRRRRR